MPRTPLLWACFLTRIRRTYVRQQQTCDLIRLLCCGCTKKGYGRYGRTHAPTHCGLHTRAVDVKLRTCDKSYVRIFLSFEFTRYQVVVFLCLFSRVLGIVSELPIYRNFGYIGISDIDKSDILEFWVSIFFPMFEDRSNAFCPPSPGIHTPHMSWADNERKIRVSRCYRYDIIQDTESNCFVSSNIEYRNVIDCFYGSSVTYRTQLSFDI